MYRSLLPFFRLRPPPVADPAVRVATLVADLFQTGRMEYDGSAIVLHGRLLFDADDAFPLLRSRLEREGFTPMLRRVHGAEVLIAVPGVVRPRPVNPLINILLFLITVGTTMWAGSILAEPPTSVVGLLNPLRLLKGLPFALALLSILGIHELGHYYIARRHGVDVTPPYFIPVPFGLGTFGAFIRLRSPVENRKALFDVGVAGPVAGFVVAVPLMMLGLALSEVGPYRGTAMGSSLLVRWLADVVRPHGPAEAIYLHPIAIAAYIGLWVTAMNLLPVSQLDGGHVAYSVLGQVFRYVAWGTMLLMLSLGLTVWEGWLIWAAFVAFMGPEHPPPLNDITPLDNKRLVWAAVAALIFVVTFVPRPF